MGEKTGRAITVTAAKLKILDYVIAGLDGKRTGGVYYI